MAIIKAYDLSVDSPSRATIEGLTARNTREALLKEATLTLDFANNKYEVYEGPVDSLTQRPFNDILDFTRASAATARNATGGITDVLTDQQRLIDNREGLLIEESRTNLISYPRRFDNGVWTNFQNNYQIISNSEAAPDGSLTADKLIPTSNIENALKQSANYVDGQTYTVSLYAKAAENTQLKMVVSSTIAGAFINVNVDLITGDLTSSGPVISPKSKNVGGGWIRVTLAFTSIASVASDNGFWIGEDDTNPDGTSGIYIWGAQLEEGSFATSVIPDATTFTSRSTTATFLDATGTIQTAAIDVARDDAYGYDENGILRPIGLLLEDASTNLLTYSEEFDNAAWTKLVSTTVTANSGTAPDGTTTADRLEMPAGSGTLISQSFSATANEHTFSVWLKSNTGSEQTLDIYVNNSSPGLTDGAGKLVTVTSNWKRFEVSGLATSGTLYADIDNNANLEVVDVLVWGAQVEESPYATSYIPTAGSQVTRAADVSSSPQSTRAADDCIRTLGAEFNADGFTVFIDAKILAAIGGNALIGSNESTFNPVFTGGGDSLFVDLRAVGGVAEITGYTFQDNDSVKIGVSLSSDSVIVAVNGNNELTKSGLSLSFNLISDIRLFLRRTGDVQSGTIKDFRIFPTALSAAELETLTGGA